MVYPHSYRTEHSETKTTNSTYGEYYARQLSSKIKIQPPLLKILQYVDSNNLEFRKNLSAAVKIRSVSGSLKYRTEVMKMIKFTEKWLIKLGVKYECFNIGTHILDDKEVKLPPVILGTLGSDSSKKTVCVYAYLDVKKPLNGKWNTDPWTLTEIDKKLYGSGVAAGKGTLMSWFHVCLAFQASKMPLPVNLKFIIESMHQQDSEGLYDFLMTRKQDFLYNVDYTIVCESEWLGEKWPCITYGCVGVLHFETTVEKDDNSSSHPKDDIAKIFDRICDEQENILIPDFNIFVQQITPDEEKVYEAIEDFDPEELRGALPPFKQNWSKVKLLMHFWRLPSILVDDVQECICEKQDTTTVKRHFLIKIVPRQIADKAVTQTLQHIHNVCSDLKIQNKVDCQCISVSRPWTEDFRSPHYEAARKATIQIYKENPSMIREDRDMKFLSTLNTILEKNILVLPLGSKSSNAGHDNENIALRNFSEGTKLLAAYLFQVAYIT